MTAKQTVIGWLWNAAAFGLTLVCAAVAEAVSLPLDQDPSVSLLGKLTAGETGATNHLANPTSSPMAWIEAAFALFVIVLAACLAPVRVEGQASVRRGLDIVTAAVCGLIAAKILLGFPGMPWADMWVWGGVAVIPALVIVVRRFKRMGQTPI